MPAAPPEEKPPPKEWFVPGPTLTRFHGSPARVRFAIGARGAGKSHSALLEAIQHCMNHAGAKVLVVRKTEVSQADTTIETLQSLFVNFGGMFVDTGASLFKLWNDGRSIRVPSMRAIERYNQILKSAKSKSELMRWLDTEGTALCSFIEMRGLSSALVAENKLRGFECSLMILVEADLLNLSEFKMAVPCIRWRDFDGNYIRDGGMIVETNPPGPDHWIAVLEAETRNGQHPNYAFFHIKTEENSHNLPTNYVNDLKEVYRNDPAMYRRMVDGEYAEAHEGSPIFHAYREDIHAGDDLPWPKGAYMARGWDFGTNNAVIWAAYWMENGFEYFHVLLEQYLSGSDTERQAIQAVNRTTSEFPFWNNRSICAGILDFSDPAGAASNFSTAATASNVKILNTHGVFPGTKLWERGLQIGLAIVNRMLEKRDSKGRPCFKLDRKNCPMLWKAFCGKYRWPMEHEAGWNSNTPVKGHDCGHVDHVCDAMRYPLMNVMKLLREEFEPLKPSARRQEAINPNPVRRW